jgi:co-chaperonin GroES (HSP10)
MVVAGVGFIPTVVKPGDKVILPTMGFTKFEFEGEEFWIGPENGVLCKINNK